MATTTRPGQRMSTLLLWSWLISCAGVVAAQPQDDLQEDIPEAQVTQSEEKAEAPAARQTRNPVISLQTKVTGNQEQPRVLYLIPWQSPRASRTDFEHFEGLRTPVFGHLERDEFRRELEARGEFD